MKFGYFLSLLYGVDLFVPYFSASPLNFRVKYTENSCMYWIPHRKRKFGENKEQMIYEQKIFFLHRYIIKKYTFPHTNF